MKSTPFTLALFEEKGVSNLNGEVIESLITVGGKPNYMLGRNKYSESVAKIIEAEAFIDDFTAESSYLGRPIVKMSQVPKNSSVVSCVVDAKPVTALRNLRSFGIQAIDYFSLVRRYPEKFMPIDYCGNNQNDIIVHFMIIFGYMSISRIIFQKIFLKIFFSFDTFLIWSL